MLDFLLKLVQNITSKNKQESEAVQKSNGAHNTEGPQKGECSARP